MKTKKITIVALHLSYGGVEKAIIDLANSLVEKYEVEIISTYRINDKPAFELSPKVKIVYLLKDKPNKKEFVEAIKKYKFIKVLKEGLKSIKILYEKRKLLIKNLKNLKTDVIITTRALHNRIIGKYINSNTIKIAWEHNHHQNNKMYIRKTINSVKQMDYFVLVSKELYKFYKDKVRITCKYIPNSIEFSEDYVHNPQKKLIAVGRLEAEKGFTDLINIFYEFSNEFQDYKLTIIGDGSQRKILEAEVNKLNLKEKIELKGYMSSKEVHNELNSSMLYLMTSYTESFGIVLIEAMAHGIPCIAYDSANGAKEIIKNGYNGYLITNRNKKEYIKILKKIINNPDLYDELSKEATKQSKNYNKDKVIKKWENLVESNK